MLNCRIAPQARESANRCCFHSRCAVLEDDLLLNIYTNSKKHFMRVF